MTVKDTAHCDVCGGILSGVLCESCNHIQVQDYSIFLNNGTKIDKKYTIQELVYCDDEACFYLGKASKSQMDVLVIEFFPRSISMRNSNDKLISPQVGKEVQFKTLMADFEYLYQQLIKLSKETTILQVMDTCSAFGTQYAICKFEHLSSVNNYLEKRAEPYTWLEIKHGFMQLCKTVNMVHAQGIIHRGISPKTVFVNGSGSLVLYGFATSANRTRNSEIVGTLFEGYAALEQYHHNMWQGTWTDVYALGAFLYRMLTGKTPHKDENGKITPANILQPTIPDNVSDAISAAMWEDYTNRLQTIDEFTAMLLENLSTNTAVFTASPAELLSNMQHTRVIDKLPDYPQEISDKTIVEIPSQITTLKKTRKTPAHWFEIVAMFSCAIIIATSFYNFNDRITPIELPPLAQEKLKFDTYEIQDFTGVNTKSLLGNAQYSGYEFYIIEEFHNYIEKGTVIEQYPSGGTTAVNKANIILRVSKGKEAIPLPALLGMQIEEAKSVLEGLGIRYQVFEVVDETMEEGIVGRVNFQEGAKVNLHSDTVYLFTKRKLPEKKPQVNNKSSSSSSEESQDPPEENED